MIRVFSLESGEFFNVNAETKHQALAYAFLAGEAGIELEECQKPATWYCGTSQVVHRR
jgi:hypothetical protein